MSCGSDFMRRKSFPTTHPRTPPSDFHFFWIFGFRFSGFSGSYLATKASLLQNPTRQLVRAARQKMLHDARQPASPPASQPGSVQPASQTGSQPANHLPVTQAASELSSKDCQSSSSPPASQPASQPVSSPTGSQRDNFSGNPTQEHVGLTGEVWFVVSGSVRPASACSNLQTRGM